MKTIGIAVFLILSAQLTWASDFNLPTLTYDQRKPGSLPSAPASGVKSGVPRYELPAASKHSVSGKLDRDGIIVPFLPGHLFSSRSLDLLTPDYKLRVDKAPKMDQGMIVRPDDKR